MEFRVTLRLLIENAFIDGLKAINDIKDTFSFGSYLMWPSLSFNKSGMPEITKGNPFQKKGPKDYASVFGPKEREINLNSFDSMKKVIDFIRNAPIEIKCRILTFYTKENNQIYDQYVGPHVMTQIKYLIDRYIHVKNTFTFSEPDFDEIYTLWENLYFSDKLYVDIMVPILFVRFDFEDISLNDYISIIKLRDDYHLARVNLKAYDSDMHDLICQNATHAFMSRGWYLLNEEAQLTQKNISASSFPLDHIDTFFASLRIITGINTGYAQLIFDPKNWISRFKAALPSLEGTTIRKYPFLFENFYWLKDEFPLISSEIAKTILNLYDRLNTDKHKSLKLALRRLNNCYLRENEEDTILDATIALEALLCPEHTQEITHKLALRLAALSKINSLWNEKPIQIFETVKRIYKYRSKVVHGSTESTKSRLIKIDDKKNIEVVSKASEYLRYTIQTLAENSKYLAPETIDNELILGEKPLQGNP